VKYLFLIILFYFSSCFAQANKSIIDTAKKSNSSDTLKQIILSKGNDTIPRKSLLELKTVLTQNFYNINKFNIELRNEEDYEYFTQEELSSGLSKKQLIAYKKNKEMLLGILQKKYDDAWYYRVKSLGELIGIPDWVIKMLQFSLLLL